MVEVHDSPDEAAEWQPELGPQGIDRHAARSGLAPAAGRLVEVLDHSEPMRVDDLAAELEVHPNTVRTHLDELLERGVVRRRPHHDGGRGRPQWLYSTVPLGADQGTLVRVLAAHVNAEFDDVAAASRKIGERWGELVELVELQGDDPVEALIEALAELGFSPEHLRADDGHELRLRTCPILEAAKENPSVICSIHQGMLDRVWSKLGRESQVTLSAFDGPGWCSVAVPRV